MDFFIFFPPVNIILEISEITIDDNFTLENDDTLILYTDGLPETKNLRQQKISAQLLNYKGFVNIIKKHIHKSVEEVKEGILNDTVSWSQNIIHDDMTLIVIRKK